MFGGRHAPDVTCTRLGDRKTVMHSYLVKATTMITLALFSTVATANRYLDESFREPTGRSGPNIGLGLLLLGGVMFLCFSIAEIRKVGYIVSSVLLLLSVSGATEYLYMAVPILTACLAGTLLERKAPSKRDCG